MFWAAALALLVVMVLGGCGDDETLPEPESVAATGAGGSGAGGAGAGGTGGMGGAMECGGIACGEGACCLTPLDLLREQLVALAAAAGTVAAAARGGDLDEARARFAELWVVGIQPRYVLERVAPTSFDLLYEPVGAHELPSAGIHAVEGALFGHEPSLGAAASLATALAEDASSAAQLPAVDEAALFDGLIAAWRLPVDLIAGSETPLAGPSAAALEALGHATHDYVALVPSLLVDEPELVTAMETLLAIIAADPGSDATLLASLITASADLDSELAQAAENRRLEIAASSSDDFSQLFLDLAAFQANFGADGAQAIELGKLLFFDPVLSELDERACASCHDPELGYSDGRRFGLAIDLGDLPRSTPTIVNAAMQHGALWDSSVDDLPAQALGPLSDAAQMGSDLPTELQQLAGIPEYVVWFDLVFVDGISAQNVALALAAFEASAVTLDSPADRFLAGDTSALSAAEQRGLSLFVGKARCANCHRVPLFAGTAAPDFNLTDSRTLGIPAENTGLTLDDDLGVGAVSLDPADNHAFRVPTLRNIQETAPYMHNGVFATLEEVVAFYDGGGGPGLGLDVPNADPRLVALELTADEAADLVAFLGALGDGSEAPSAPASVPSGLAVGGTL
jgi:cytochrome c peroxidase